MKLLLCKNVDKLGIVGDVVIVKPGYGRNYLVPQGLATEPTETNMRALAEARKIAEAERAHMLAELKALAERIEGVEVIIRARANEQGHLYGSVGPREIAAALEEEGFPVKTEQIILPNPIRQLENNMSVDLKLGDATAAVNVWVVREKVEGEDDEFEGEHEGEVAAGGEETQTSTESTEAGEDGDGTGS
ncbi:MAG: 50S ribosomal protein L9 [Planctomycetota bacterium]